tara:strand:- start:855 stop:1073 length:219 start_codon:yes stop_codon:yes gene_type:complete
MNEETQKDIITILMKSGRADLVAIMMTIFEEMNDSDFESQEEDEPPEEYMEGGAIPEDPSFCMTGDGFYYLK